MLERNYDKLHPNFGEKIIQTRYMDADSFL